MRKTTATIPVVICTTAIRLSRDLDGYLASKGVSAVLKPFDIDDLLPAIKKVLELRHSEVSLVEGENGEAE